MLSTRKISKLSIDKIQFKQVLCMSIHKINLMSKISYNLIFTIALIVANLSLLNQSARAERGCIVTDEGTTICGSTTNSKKKNKQPTQNTGFNKVVGNLLVELKGCSRQDDTDIVCQFNLTNKGERRSLNLSSFFSAMVDSSGRSNQALYSRVGSSGGVLGASLDEAEPGIAYAASLTFKDIPQSVNKVQLLTIGATLNYASGRIQFRNIPISN